MMLDGEEAKNEEEGFEDIDLDEVGASQQEYEEESFVASRGSEVCSSN